MSSTEHGITTYSLADLRQEARFALRGHKCPDCGRNLWAVEVGIFVGKATGLQAKARCPVHHNYTATIIGAI